MVSATTLQAIERYKEKTWPYLLEIEGVRKEFPGVVALDNVQFRLRPGTVHALMGENGAGKSTLMKIIAGIYTPDSGTMCLRGEEIHLKGPRDALEYGIAMIHQELALMTSMTVAENIWIRREPTNAFGLIDHARMAADTKALFEQLNIGVDPLAEIGSLTVAQQQMVEIAKAVSYESDVLIMDEPTSALTETEAEHLFGIIRDLRARGIGIVYITHKMNELFEIADEFSVFRDGSYVGTHASTDVTRDDIIHIMVGREITEMFPKAEAEIGDAVLEVENLGLPGVFHGISFTLRRGEILGVAGLVGSGRSNVAEAIFGVVQAKEGTIRVNGREVAIRSPADAMREGMALLTEDRKDTGCFLPLSILENMQIAALHERHADAPQDQDAQSRRAHREPVGRQPAEGADRPLAAHQTEDPDPRRADARYRRGRQGGNPPPDLPAGTGWCCRHHDLIGTARGSRHVRPDHGHARGTHDRHSRPGPRPIR